MATTSPDGSRPDSPFHAGELAIQERAGGRAQAAVLGQRGIRAYMPEQHRQFFPQLPFVLVGSIDASGQPWASVLAGRPGFMHSPDPHTLRIDARPLPEDQLDANLQLGARLGMLGIELPARRRNRLNGQVTALDPAGFSVSVLQSFGNCPRYIQGRDAVFVEPPGPPRVDEHEKLNEADRALIEAADTLFIATNAAPPGNAPDARSTGADVSHRGGRPGFVRVADQGTLMFPDFNGNSLYQTLGNLQLDPRAGLIFIDFASGDLLQLCCSATLVWDGPELSAFAGAERLLRLRVERVRRLVNVLPLRWSAPEYSPYVARTGTWQEAEALLATQHRPAT
jgi:predicted pyridoxine 5'-phosphate oxidase superfamily flavin-nucleotide-binding protein